MPSKKMYLKGWKKLEHLNLRGTKVNDTGLEHLKSLSHLKSLDASFAEVTDAGLELNGDAEWWASHVKDTRCVFGSDQEDTEY